MIDIHSHILPGLDDGAKDLEMSLAMADMAIADGITEIVATPHFAEEFNYTADDVMKAYELLRKEIEKRNLPLKLHYGLEVQINPEIFEKYADNLNDLTVNRMGKYMLVELPFLDIPVYTEDIVRYIVANEITPILVHPLRNSRILENISILYSFREMGALFQFNRSSVLGAMNINTFSIISRLMKRDLVHFIASDSHGLAKRKPILSDAYRKVRRSYCEETAKQLFLSNPAEMISGDTIDILYLNKPSFFDKIVNIFKTG